MKINQKVSQNVEISLIRCPECSLKGPIHLLNADIKDEHSYDDETAIYTVNEIELKSELI